MSRFFLLGSRSLPPSGLAVCRSVGASLARLGVPGAVGCAPGADESFVSGWLSVPGAASRLSVFAVGSSSGEGFPVPSVSVPVVRRAAFLGAPVSWCAGGPLSLPLRVRLAARSSACLAASSGLAFAVVSSPVSRGSWRSLRLAFAAGLSCLVVPVGFPPSRLPRLAARGAWVRDSFAGVACWRWLVPPA